MKIIPIIFIAIGICAFCIEAKPQTKDPREHGRQAKDDRTSGDDEDKGDGEETEGEEGVDQRVSDVEDGEDKDGVRERDDVLAVTEMAGSDEEREQGDEEKESVDRDTLLRACVLEELMDDFAETKEGGGRTGDGKSAKAGDVRKESQDKEDPKKVVLRKKKGKKEGDALRDDRKQASTDRVDKQGGGNKDGAKSVEDKQGGGDNDGAKSVEDKQRTEIEKRKDRLEEAKAKQSRRKKKGADGVRADRDSGEEEEKGGTKKGRKRGEDQGKKGDPQHEADVQSEEAAEGKQGDVPVEKTTDVKEKDEKQLEDDVKGTETTGGDVRGGREDRVKKGQGRRKVDDRVRAM